VHSTYTEKLQINGQIKLYTIYTNTVNRQMELAGRTEAKLLSIYIYIYIIFHNNDILSLIRVLYLCLNEL
jgi:hypothetical protein